MNLSSIIARRYLFSKKSSHLINFITGISVVGITVGTTALILVMSVFNGFQDVIYSLFNTFNPDLKVTPQSGKVFTITAQQLEEIRGIRGVVGVSRTLEETALFEYKDNRDFGKIKGVDYSFSQVTSIDSMLTEGVNLVADTVGIYALVGHGINLSLNTDIEDQFTPITVYVPGRSASSALVSGSQAFVWRHIYPSGVFSIQQDFDNEYILAPLSLCQDLLHYDTDKIGALELKLEAKAEVKTIKKTIQGILNNSGPFDIRNKYEQEEAFLKLMNVEKWMAFAILSLSLLLVAFNLIGALWMIVLEKQKDITILKAIGAERRLIMQIFIKEGLLISALGLMGGFILALLIYFLQKQFGLVPLKEGFIIDAYPISLRWWDFLMVSGVVLGIGWVASLLPAFRSDKIGTFIRQE